MIDSVLLGCTELPIVMNEDHFKGKKIISSIDEYIMYLL
jgi:aspartate/glutamate racemase